MILKEILEKALEIVCDDEINLKVQSKKRERLISCANTIYSELTQEYVHLKSTATLKISDGRIYYSEFPLRVKDILKVSIGGSDVGFTVYPLYVKVEADDGFAEVKYIYNVTPAGIESEIDLPPQYTASVLAMGVASEYFFRTGLSDEALFYKNRYDNALINLSRRRAPLTLSARSLI